MNDQDQQAFCESFDPDNEFHNLVQQRHVEGTLVCIVWTPPKLSNPTWVGQATFCHHGELITRRFSVKATKTDFTLKMLGRSYYVMSDHFEDVAMNTKALHYTQKDLTEEQAVAIYKYAVKYGRYWKAQLRSDWETGRDAEQEGGGYLRQIRNTFGPSWLNKFRIV